MSSGAIFAQIKACEAQIVEAKNAIVKLKSKIEDQDYAVQVSDRKLNDLQEEIQSKSAKHTTVVGHTEKAVTAFYFGESVCEKFNQLKSPAVEAAHSMKDRMQRELRSTVEQLDAMEAELTGQQSRLNGLHAEYQAALAREEAERQANMNKNLGR